MAGFTHSLTHSLKARKTIAVLIVALLVLGWPLGRALADYLGPDRTRKVTTAYTATQWDVVRWADNQYVCTYYESNAYASPLDDPHTTCSAADLEVLASTPRCNEYDQHTNPPWPTCSGYYADQIGTVSFTQTVTKTYPEATITGRLANCVTQNGWCVSTAMLALEGVEPVAGYAITLIEGTRNEEAFACSGASCEVPLVEGENAFTFWALSSWGDSSRMGSLSAKVDTRAPQVSGELSGTPGENGWYVSPVTVSASASDPEPGSGLAGLTCSVDGGPWQPYDGPLTVGEGAHTLTCRAEDRAGHSAEAGVSVQVDTTPPQVGASLDGEQVNGWYLRQATFTATASDALSGLAGLEYALDGGAWAAYSGPVTVGGGAHSVRVRAHDAAGNVAESAPLTFRVDGAAPHIQLPAAWYIWETGEITVSDGESGLARVTVAVRDPQGRWPAAEWTYAPESSAFQERVSWNRRFGDGTVAPIGTYALTVTAVDRAGNVRQASAQIVIPAPDVTPTPLPTATPWPTPTATATPVLAAAVFPAQATPTAAGPQTVQFASVEHAPAAPPVRQGDAGTARPLWGGAAGAAIAAATALALAERKRRKEEEARQARAAQAEAARRNAAEAARKAQEAQAAQQARRLLDGGNPPADDDPFRDRAFHAAKLATAVHNVKVAWQKRRIALAKRQKRDGKLTGLMNRDHNTKSVSSTSSTDPKWMATDERFVMTEGIVLKGGAGAPASYAQEAEETYTGFSGGGGNVPVAEVPGVLNSLLVWIRDNTSLLDKLYDPEVSGIIFYKPKVFSPTMPPKLSSRVEQDKIPQFLETIPISDGTERGVSIIGVQVVNNGTEVLGIKSVRVDLYLTDGSDHFYVSKRAYPFDYQILVSPRFNIVQPGDSFRLNIDPVDVPSGFKARVAINVQSESGRYGTIIQEIIP